MTPQKGSLETPLMLVDLFWLIPAIVVSPNTTYHGDDLCLDSLVQGNQTKVETEVELNEWLC